MYVCVADLLYVNVSWAEAMGAGSAIVAEQVEGMGISEAGEQDEDKATWEVEEEETWVHHKAM